MNKSVQILFLVYCTFAVVHASWLFSGHRQKRGAGLHKMKCLGKDIDMKECFKGWHECAKEIMPEDFAVFENKDTTAEKKKEIGKKLHENGCIRHCQWTKHQHIFAENGTFDQSAVDKMVEATYPADAQSGLKTGMSTCHTEHPNAFKKDEANQCPEMKKFEECIGKIYMDVCKVDHAATDPTE